MDPDTCANALADALVLDDSTATELASDLLEWLESGGFMPNDETLLDLGGVFGRPVDKRKLFCVELHKITETS